MSQFKIATKCVQSGYSPKNGEPRVLPIAQSTTYKYDSSVQMAKLFDLEEDGFFYTRLANPTVDAVEKKIADLEGGVMAILTSSGQAASMYSVLNVCKAGDHLISSSAIYGGTFNLFNKTLRDMGLEIDFCDPDAPAEEINKLFKDNTKCVFTEMLSNPALTVLDLEKWAEAAHSHGVPLIVDNTFPTAINCRPIEFGADVVVHSTSKYMDGHACALGGVVVDSGKFDWKNGKFPMFTQPDETYHGVGLETLHLRMPRHCENAQAVAEFLANDERVAWVNFPGLPGNKYYELAQKYMPNGTCGVVSFGVKGGREAATKFMDSLHLAAIVTHVADARTCVLHPASTTHRQLNDRELEECGVSPDLIRFSVGIEDVSDIIADLDQALSAATAK